MSVIKRIDRKHREIKKLENLERRVRQRKTDARLELKELEGQLPKTFTVRLSELGKTWDVKHHQERYARRHNL